jgi:isopenicillin N synthase-like dioxygenase
VPVDPVEGGIAVNIGDMLARWSNGLLFSNLHRVRMPLEEDCDKSRYSIGYFAQSDKPVVIESDIGKITAGDYILSRIQSNFATPVERV